MEFNIFSLIIIIPIVALYGLFAVACLKTLQIPLGFSVLAIFIISGGVAGSATMFLYGVVVAGATGRLNSIGEVTRMFVLSGLVAIAASIVTAKLRTKHN